MMNRHKIGMCVLLATCLLLSINTFAYAEESLYLSYTSSGEGTYYGSEFLNDCDTDFYTEFVDCELTDGDENTNYIEFQNEDTQNWYYFYRTAVDDSFLLKELWGEGANSDVDMVQVYEDSDGDGDMEYTFIWGTAADTNPIEPGEIGSGYINWEWQRSDQLEHEWRERDYTGTDSHLFLTGISANGATPTSPSLVSPTVITINPSSSLRSTSTSEALTNTDENKKTLWETASKEELIKQGKIYKVDCPVEIFNAEKKKVYETNFQKYKSDQKQIWGQLKSKGKVKNNPFK